MIVLVLLICFDNLVNTHPSQSFWTILFKSASTCVQHEIIYWKWHNWIVVVIFEFFTFILYESNCFVQKCWEDSIGGLVNNIIYMYIYMWNYFCYIHTSAIIDIFIFYSIIILLVIYHLTHTCYIHTYMKECTRVCWHFP